MVKTQEIYKELLWVAEYPDKEAVIVADDTQFSRYEYKQQQVFLDSLLTLALDKLSVDLLNVSIHDESQTIPLSIDPRHKNIVVGMSFLMNQDKDFDLLLYFGGKADSSTELSNGIYHAARVVQTIQENVRKQQTS